MNNVNLIGNITKDIELKYLPNGVALASFSIALNQSYKDKNGLKVEKVSFVECKSFGKQAETINTYFSKGSKIAIQGELDQESWTTQDGSKRSKLVVKIDKFYFVDRKESDNNQTKVQSYPNSKLPEIDVNEDEIPF